MIEVTSKINIRERDLKVSTIRASGPGGQNVNKVSTAIQLRFRVLDSNLPESVKKRLLKIAGGLATDRSEIIILAKRHRTREKNLTDALDRLKQLIRLAFREPKPRRKTKPSVSSNEARLASKKKKSEIKKLRIGKRTASEM